MKLNCSMNLRGEQTIPSGPNFKQFSAQPKLKSALANPLTSPSTRPVTKRTLKGISHKGLMAILNLILNNSARMTILYSCIRLLPIVSKSATKQATTCNSLQLNLTNYRWRIHEIELMRMKCEFYQDENGRIYFFNATDIWIREVKKKDDFLFKEELLSFRPHLSQH